MFKEIGDELADFVDWFSEKLADDDIRREIATDLGLAPDAQIPAPKLPQDKLDSIDRYRSQANPNREAFIILLNDVRTIWESVRDFIRSVVLGSGPSGQLAAVNQAVYLVFDTLAMNYVRLRKPELYFFMQLADALVEDAAVLNKSDYVVERFFRAAARVTQIALSPIGYLFESFWFGVQDESEATLVAERTFTLLAGLLILLEKRAKGSLQLLGTTDLILGWDPLTIDNPAPGVKLTPNADALSGRMISFAFVHQETDPTTGAVTESALDVTLAIRPQSHGASGLMVALGGSGEASAPLSKKWRLRAEFSSPSSAAFLISKNLAPAAKKKWQVEAHGPQEARFIVSFTSQPDQSGVTYQIPETDETRLELGKIAFSLRMLADSVEFKASVDESRLVIATKDSDGFLAKLLPDDGLSLPLSFGLGYSDAKGVFTEGNVPLLSKLGTRPANALRDNSLAPLGQTEPPKPPNPPTLAAGGAPTLGWAHVIAIGKALGPVKVQQLLLSMSPPQDPATSALAVEVSANLEVTLGPVKATVERVGFQYGLGFPESGGNLGFGDLDFGVKRPLGVGLAIDAQAVKGAGFLRFDPDRGQYDGFVHLSVKSGKREIAVNAYGLIATRLPGQAKGFSLLILLTAEGFKPIPLPLGFRLTGIGGLLAVNRTMDADALRTGLRNRTLDGILFPKDPERNAPQILSNLNSVFPPAEGHHLFGPVVQLEWGAPVTLVTAEIAVILEFGDRFRVLILAQIAAILPNPQNDLIRLQMDAMGLIDFSAGTVALDAVLYDSRLAKKFTVTGEMAMRLATSGAPSFVLALGGVHPNFPLPANLPKLERVAISFTKGDNPRLRCEAYLALTSNTIQFGARAELYAEAAGFSIHGEVGFDVLIQVAPFHFRADFSAQLQLKRKSTNLFKVRVEGTFSGPRPLHIKALATFEVLWWDVSIRVDLTLSEGEKPPLPAPVDVLPQLLAALGDSRSWGGQVPERARQPVTLRTAAAGADLLLHPLGTLTVSQTVVPLETDIARFGSATPVGARRFAVTGARLNTQAAVFTPVRDFFAPAQYLDLSDSEKLSRPSFETMPAGITIRFDGAATNAGESVETKAIEFDTKILGSQRPGSGPPGGAPPVYTLTAARLNQQVRYGAIAMSDLRRSGGDRYQAQVGKYQVAREGWSIIAADNLAVQTDPGLGGGKPTNYSEAAQSLQRLQRADPVRAAGLKIVRLSEIQDSL